MSLRNDHNGSQNGSLTAFETAMQEITPLQQRMWNVLREENRSVAELACAARLNPMTARNVLCWLSAKGIADFDVRGQRARALSFPEPVSDGRAGFRVRGKGPDA